MSDLVTSGLGVVGDLGLGVLSARMQGSHASKMADRANDFTEKVARERIRWAVGDMKRAGINPVMAVSGGFGSSGGAGAVGSGITANLGSATSALALKRMQQDIKTSQSQEMSNIADKNLKESQANFNRQATLTERSKTDLTRITAIVERMKAAKTSKEYQMWNSKLGAILAPLQAIGAPAAASAGFLAKGALDKGKANRTYKNFGKLNQ